MSAYQKNRLRARTFNNMPSETDQSQAAETDLNVIINNFMKHGEVQGAAGQPIYGDFTELPNNLRDFIELGRSIQEHTANLPPQLKNIPTAELLALPVERINEILNPPKQEEPKE